MGCQIPAHCSSIEHHITWFCVCFKACHRNCNRSVHIFQHLSLMHLSLYIFFQSCCKEQDLLCEDEQQCTAAAKWTTGSLLPDTHGISKHQHSCPLTCNLVPDTHILARATPLPTWGTTLFTRCRSVSNIDAGAVSMAVHTMHRGNPVSFLYVASGKGTHRTCIVLPHAIS